MERLKICAVFCVALLAIVLSSPKHYNSLRAYYYRFGGGSLLVPDRPVPARHVPPSKVAARKPTDKPPNSFSISGLDPNVGPQIAVIGGAPSDPPQTSSQNPVTETPERAEPVETVSEEVPPAVD